ncbi:hypothetical protein H4R19_006190, partial [Coemansia spiralis]
MGTLRTKLREQRAEIASNLHLLVAGDNMGDSRKLTNDKVTQVVAIFNKADGQLGTLYVNAE